MTEVAKTGIIDQKGQPEGTPDVETIGHIDRDKYRGISEDIRTDEVIITDERIAHIKERHPGAYEKYSKYLKEIVENPDYILLGNRKNTAMILKGIRDEGEVTKTVLWLATHGDNPDYKNSIMTLVKIDRADWERLKRNKKILYSRQ